MRKLLFEIAYRGTRYHGYQVQKNGLTVCEVLQDALESLLGKREDIVGCSRTDAGVHANHFCFHMETESKIPLQAWPLALNRLLPKDVSVLRVREVKKEFHARYSVYAKEYRYLYFDRPERDPFSSGLCWHVKSRLDEKRMDRLAKELVGVHDFKGFSNAEGSVKDTVRQIYSCDVKRDGDYVILSIRGNGFLYNMVRIIAGTLAQRDMTKERLQKALQSGERKWAGMTAPAEGLYLNRVFYPEEWF